MKTVLKVMFHSNDPVKKNRTKSAAILAALLLFAHWALATTFTVVNTDNSGAGHCGKPYSMQTAMDPLRTPLTLQ